jgi:superfamily II DNA helicase RecQ
VLLVQPTGGGKTLVRDVHAIMNGGMSLTITPLLSLGAGQEEKLWSRPNGSAGKIVQIHHDKIQSPVEQQQIIDKINNVPVDSHTLLYFYSPCPKPLSRRILFGCR